MKSSSLVASTLALALTGLMPLGALAAGVDITVGDGSTATVRVGDDAMEGSSGVHISASTTGMNGTGAEVDVHAAGGQETAENARENNSAQVILVQNGAGVVVTTPAQVASEDDLQVYAHNVRASDAHVASVETSAADHVAVAYAHRAYLFGFIPVMATLSTSVSAGASGTAKAMTSYPWWSFLASGDAKVGTQVDASLESDTAVQALGSGAATASERAAAIAAIIAAHAQASASASASAQ